MEKLSKAEQILYNICLKQSIELFMKEVENVHKELKYYTPDIEDIHLGYELEVEELEKADNNPDDIDSKWWKKVIIDTTVDEDILEFCGNSITGIKNRDMVYVRNTFRTPYLTKEQIEAEGWKVEWNDGNDGIEYVYYCKGEWKLSYSTGWEEKVNEIVLIKGVPLYYRGECKSINELRTICKLLNIK